MKVPFKSQEVLRKKEHPKVKLG